MAFLTIPSSTIEAGDPVTQDLWSLTKDNLDDHETRIVSVEGGGNVVYVPSHWNVQGYYGDWQTFIRTGTVRIPFNIDILGGRLLTNVAGTGGDTEIDFLFKRGAGAFTTIFSSKPTSNFSAGDNDLASGTLNVTSLLLGDLLRMDITASQTGDPIGLTGIFEFEKT